MRGKSGFWKRERRKSTPNRNKRSVEKARPIQRPQRLLLDIMNHHLLHGERKGQAKGGRRVATSRQYVERGEGD